MVELREVLGCQYFTTEKNRELQNSDKYWLANISFKRSMKFPRCTGLRILKLKEYFSSETYQLANIFQLGEIPGWSPLLSSHCQSGEEGRGQLQLSGEGSVPVSLAVLNFSYLYTDSLGMVCSIDTGPDPGFNVISGSYGSIPGSSTLLVANYKKYLKFH